MSTQIQDEKETMMRQARLAFALGIKVEVTPRGSDGPIEIHIRPFYVDQALELIDEIEMVWTTMRELSKKDDAEDGKAGDVDLLAVFKAAKDQVLKILTTVIEKDRAFIGKLEIQDLLMLLQTVFKYNKDFFDQSVMPMVAEVISKV